MQYPVVLSDFPWHFQNWGRDVGRRSAASHYKTQMLDFLKALPIYDVMAKDSVLLMWTSGALLKDSLELGLSYGLKYGTMAYVWHKRTVTDRYDDFGLGYWTRAQTEQVLLFTKGKPKRRSKRVRQLVVAPKTRIHSEKPGALYPAVEELLEGPYLELFARKVHPGWHALGFDIDGRDIRESLPDLISRTWHEIEIPLVARNLSSSAGTPVPGWADEVPGSEPQDGAQSGEGGPGHP